MTLTVGSLFSGIGGLDLGLERAGMRVIWQSEIDPYASRVLAKHWKDVPNHGDIKKIDWTQIERPDIICGGYPCQPFSTAGRRLGQEDPRHLFPYVLTAISKLRPRYAVLENVRGHLSLGGVSVISDLASIGYDAEWTIVSAASQGAPHIRERLIILAYPVGTFSNSDSFGCVFGQLDEHTTERKLDAFGDIGSSSADVPNPNEQRLQRRCYTTNTERQNSEGHTRPSDWWETEPDVGRVAHGIHHRVDRLRGLGNAVVPQVAEFVGRLVVAHAERSL